MLVVLDYSTASVVYYENITTDNAEKIENFLSKYYNLDEICYMCSDGITIKHYFNKLSNKFHPKHMD